MLWVSCKPVSLISLSEPYEAIPSSWTAPNLSQIDEYNSSLPPVRIASFEKLVCIPEPFQSPVLGFGCIFTPTPNSSAILYSMYRLTHKSSAALIPLPKHWYSHWPIATSAFVPVSCIPKSKHAIRCASEISLPETFPAPTAQ